ncbi:hypothetical protein ETD86_18460 [Nonomuraea turkmeniaca]|uniref:Uncharacterized protein n=1 Tax=Nonomuraea turkmeniaca TaxID=103838 RepID=A0A5S4FIU5_9ACTN|nr:hypothetical protein [Nonomuraea turkmeniaca]TMR20535.1 hypothetical protein ETD86_18460 [Nonomuraea turkmeniaca]
MTSADGAQRRAATTGTSNPSGAAVNWVRTRREGVDTTDPLLPPLCRDGARLGLAQDGESGTGEAASRSPAT